MDTKKCGACEIVLSIDNFRKNKSRKDGYSWGCKQCSKEYNKKNYSTEKNSERWKKYYSANSEKIKSKSKEYYERTKIRQLEKSKRYRDINKELISQKKIEYRVNNKDKLKDYESRCVEELNDRYIKSLFRDEFYKRVKNIPQELIDLKRVQVQITRKLKEINKCNQLL